MPSDSLCCICWRSTGCTGWEKRTGGPACGVSSDVCQTRPKRPFAALTVTVVSGEGVTLGAHRMYSHKAFKGSWLIRFVVIVLHTIAGQVSQHPLVPIAKSQYLSRHNRFKLFVFDTGRIKY